LTHAKDRALREEMYRAYVTRASALGPAPADAAGKEDGGAAADKDKDKGGADNTPVIDKILALRQEKAKLLGYETFAHLSMASKMATLEEAEKLLEELRLAARPAAVKDLAEVREFAAQQGETEELLWWDVAYWAERLREARYELNDEELRPYFSLPAVLDGLFALAKRLFDVTVVPADGEAPVWHPDARFFKLLGADGAGGGFFGEKGL
jgi:oligopeptidase A